VKKRTSDPWIPADRYGRMLPVFMANLIVQDVERATAFYKGVLGGRIHYADADFAAINLNGAELMLHADHTYDKHPWHPRLTGGERRGLGAELRLFGVDPDVVESRARKAGAPVHQPATSKGHGWREVMVEDPDGYVWAVGVPTAPQP
jgi:uncharacterized glyoxalase superfamily protein PhnB